MWGSPPLQIQGLGTSTCLETLTKLVVSYRVTALHRRFPSSTIRYIGTDREGEIRVNEILGSVVRHSFGSTALLRVYFSLVMESVLIQGSTDGLVSIVVILIY